MAVDPAARAQLQTLLESIQKWGVDIKSGASSPLDLEVLAGQTAGQIVNLAGAIRAALADLDQQAALIGEVAGLAAELASRDESAGRLKSKIRRLEAIRDDIVGGPED